MTEDELAKIIRRLRGDLHLASGDIDFIEELARRGLASENARLKEREACAKVALDHGHGATKQSRQGAALDIAAAIRARVR